MPCEKWVDTDQGEEECEKSLSQIFTSLLKLGYTYRGRDQKETLANM